MKRFSLILMALVATMSLFSASLDLATIDNVSADLVYNCGTAKYEATLEVLFSDYPSGLTVSSPLMASPEQVTDPQSPYTLHLTDLALTAGQSSFFTVSLYSDAACTMLIASRDYTFTTPEAKCEKTRYLSACIGDALTLRATVSGDFYSWSSGEDTRTIHITPDAEDTLDYTVWSSHTVVTPERNLMANGGFEKNPPSFLSDYSYVGWRPTDYYTSHPGASNLYAITNNATNFWHDFAPVKPHGGSSFAIFDAGKSGYAWYVTTAQSPDLVLIKDSTYHFSYWVANPNTPQYSGSPAVLQFVIEYADGSGVKHKENLGIPYTLPTTDNAWHQQLVTWKAPVSSSKVLIGVYDMNSNDGDGNDFCLDDIMFQTLSKTTSEIVFTERFIITVKDCDCSGPAVYRKWDDFLFVDNSDTLYTAYQWYHNNTPIDGATEQYYRITNADGSHTPSGVYSVLLTLTNGTTIESCPQEFTAFTPSAPIYPADAQKVPVQTRTYFIGDHMQIITTIYDDDSIESTKQVVF